jgi:flagellar basal-body rod modification protein FlgD
MTVTSGTSQVGAAGKSGTGKTGSLGSNFDTFLQLLTKQLQNQDPLSPMDATKFTSQLVEFASVEQAIGANDRLDQLVGSMQASTRAAAFGLLGRHVTVDTAVAQLETSGAARFAYDLGTTAKSVEVKVVDVEGRVVRVLEGGCRAGTNRIEWDGKNSQDVRQPAGLYHLEVTALDRAGQSIPVTTAREGDVASVAARAAQVSIDIGQGPVPIDAITSARLSADA